MDKLNLWDIEDEDIEFFLDTIRENTILDGELLPPNQKQDFGNYCSIAVSYTHLTLPTKA